MSSETERNALVEQYRPMAVRLARRYRHTSEPLEDLVQVASLGLVLAADRYSPERGGSFASFAIPTILGELRRHLRDHGWATRVPRAIQENVLRVTKVTDDLSADLGRAPTLSEVARGAGLEVDQVIEATQAAPAYAADSLDRQSAGEDDEREPLVAVLGEVDRRYAFIDQAVSLRPAVEQLSARERVVLGLRFFEDLTQSEIAARLGVSQMHVSRTLRRALESIRDTSQVAA